MQYKVVIFFYYCEMQGILCGKEVVFRVDIQINNGYRKMVCLFLGITPIFEKKIDKKDLLICMVETSKKSYLTISSRIFGALLNAILIIQEENKQSKCQFKISGITFGNKHSE